MILAAGASFGLSERWRYWAIGLQAASYFVALSDSWMPGNFPLKRLTSPIRTFAVLMLASLCSLAIIFVPASVLWKETRVSGAHGKHHSHGVGTGAA
jgi:hypothetical protein